MRKKLLSYVSMLSAFLLASPVRADELSARQALQSVSDCLILHREKQALQIFVTPYNARDFRVANRPLLEAFPGCLQAIGKPAANINIANMTPNDFDAMIAGALIRSLYSNNDPGDLGYAPFRKTVGVAPMPAISLPIFKEDRQKVFQSWLVDAGGVYTDLLADCVVRSDSRNVRHLILSAADSSAEQSALEDLKPDISGCMPERMGVAVSSARLRDRMSVFYLKFATSLESSK